MKYPNGKTFRSIAAAIMLMSPCIAFGQALFMSPSAPIGEEVLLFREIPSVYGASKYEQKLTEAPSSVSIVTASEIRKYGYRTLADILRSVRSFYATNDRNYNYVGVRGFGRPGDYNTRILLLLDGHRLNDNIYDHARVGTEGILDVDLIDRVEVIRGAGSSLYGNNAFFAVVNIITRNGRDLKGTEISAEAARYETYKGRLSYGDRFQNGFEVILSGSSYGSVGQNLFFQEFDPANPQADPRASNGGVFEGGDYDRFHRGFSKVTFGDFTLESAYSSRTKGIPTGAFDTDFNDGGTKSTDVRGYGDLKYNHNLGMRADVEARLYYDYYGYTGDYIYSSVVNRDLGYGAWGGGEVQVNARPADMHRLVIGGEYIANLHQDQKNYDIDPYTLYLDDARSSAIWAAYLQDEITFSHKLVLNAGVRYDHYHSFGGTTNPRVALIYTPGEKNAVKLLAGSAFRAPNYFELYYTSATNQSNPDLKPEKIRTYELVYEHNLDDGLRLSTEGYVYQIRDLINLADAAPLPGTVFRNIDSVSAQGFELEMEKNWPSGFEGRITYTIQRAENKETGDPLTNSPEHLVKLNLSAPLMADKVFAAVEERYMSARRTIGGDTVPGFFLTNITLSTHRIGERLELSLSLYNLFDKKYDDPVSADFVQHSIQQDGRVYRGKITYDF